MKLLITIILFSTLLITIILFFTAKFKNTIVNSIELRSDKNNTNIIKENFKFDIYDESEIDQIRIKGAFKESFDWATFQNQYNKPCLSPVKDQGYCGSCWAVILTSILENSYFRSILSETDELKKFSIQQFLDCYSEKPPTTTKPCKGCDGCPMPYILDIIKDKKNLQLCSEEDYKYISFDQVGEIDKPKYPEKKLFEYNKCGLNKCINSTFIPGLQVYEISVPESLLDRIIYKLGPLYIPVRFKDKSKYYRGIYTGDIESDAAHAVILTGWGVIKSSFSTQKYWIIQNSWGNSWGNNGYAWIPRSKSGKYGLYGKNNISVQLYSVNIIRPPKCSAYVNIEKINLTYLPNTKSLCIYKINAYIPDDSYVLEIKVKSTTNDNTYLSEITDLDNNLLEKINNIDIKVADNLKNYYCNNKASVCLSKQDFSYIFKADVDKILYNNWNIICNIYNKPDLTTSVLTINKEITWGDINIIINNIDILKNTISYNILRTIDYTESKPKLLLLYNLKVIYSVELNSIYKEGSFVADADDFDTDFINNQGLYEFYIENSINRTLYSNVYKSSCRSSEC